MTLPLLLQRVREAGGHREDGAAMNVIFVAILLASLTQEASDGRL